MIKAAIFMASLACFACTEAQAYSDDCISFYRKHMAKNLETACGGSRFGACDKQALCVQVQARLRKEQKPLSSNISCQGWIVFRDDQSLKAQAREKCLSR